MIIVMDLKMKSLTSGPTLPDYFQDLKYIAEADQHSGTALLDCKFHLKDYQQNIM